MSLGMSEPDAGSAVTELKTSAKPDGTHYVINGTKVFSTFSPDAAIFLVYVRYGPGVGGIGSVLVERGTPGFTIGQPSSFMSGEEWCELHFENCRIPAENVLLGPGGFKKQMAGFNVERLGNTARSLAFGRYCLQPGARACRRPASSSAGRCASSRACSGSSPTWRSSSKARSFCSIAPPPMPTAVCRRPTRPRSPRPPATRPASRSRTKRCRSWARSATATRALVEYCMRRCRGWMIAGGSIEMLKNRIAEHVFDRRFDQRPPKPKTCRGGGVTQADCAQALLAPQLGRDRRAVERRDQDRRAAAEISAAGRLCRPHLSDQSAARQRAGRARLAVARGAAGGARSRLHRDADRRRDRGGRGMRPARRQVATVLADGFAEAGAEGVAREARLRDDLRATPASASSGRRASASSICAPERCSPPMPPSTSRTCRSAASSSPRIPAA